MRRSGFLEIVFRFASHANSFLRVCTHTVTVTVTVTLKPAVTCTVARDFEQQLSCNHVCSSHRREKGFESESESESESRSR